MRLVPRMGEIYGHVFENPRAGLARNLFWNISVDFEPVSLDGEDWGGPLSIEWLILPVRRWRDLDLMSFSDVVQPDLVEVSIYAAGEHHSASLERLALAPPSEGGDLQLDVKATATFEADDGQAQLIADFKAPLRFAGIIVVPGDLDPKPTSAAEVGAAVMPWLSLEDLAPPTEEGFRYRLLPAEDFTAR